MASAALAASLAELQRAFAGLSTQTGEHCAATLVRGSPGLSPREGMQIYANMFTWRQVDSLQEDFPKLAAVIGDHFFSLCQAYLTTHPSRHHSLARLGSSLPAYLAASGGLRQDLADLAALEWARCEVFEEASLPVLSTLLLMDAERPLTIIPALRLLKLEHEAASVWNAVEAGAPIPEPRRAPSCIVVWRKGFDVYHVAVDSIEANALARAISGETLTQICETFAEQSDAIGAASRAIGSWFSEGWIAQGAT